MIAPSTHSAHTSGLDLHLGGLRFGDVDPRLGDTRRNARARLADAFREAVRTGRLAPGTRLPSSRVLASDLGLGRNTVVRAYSELIDEGWLTGRQGSGTEVAQRAPEPAAGSHVQRPPTVRPPALRPPLLHDLRPGQPDLSSFPRAEWIQSVKRTVSTAPSAAFGYGDPHGHDEVRETIAGYLNRARGLHARADNVVVCSGAAEGLQLVATILVKMGVTTVAVEEFGLRTQRETLTKAGLHIIPIPVDADGADPCRLDETPVPGAILLTPSHQFPLGVPLRPDRRAAIVDWARRRGTLVIEDDYDGEFRYDRSPVGALQGLDHDHVIYMGTASKSLAPGLRLGWLVVPDRWVSPIVAEKGWADGTVGFVTQLAMGDFIASGAYDRHIRAMRTHYRRRRERLVEMLAEQTPTTRVTGMSAGLHIVVEQPGRTGAELVRRAVHQQLTVLPLDFYRHPESTSAREGITVGFAAPSVSAWSGALEALARTLR